MEIRHCPSCRNTGYTLDYEKILSGTIQSIKPSGIRKFFDLLTNMSDVTALTVNGSGSNLTMSQGQYPVAGTVTVQEG